MDEQDTRDKRGGVAGQSSVQPSEETNKHFVRNGFEIFTFNSKTIVSWSLLSMLCGLIFATLAVYRSFGTQVDERIVNHRELNRKLDKFEYDIQNLKDDSKDMEQRIIDVERYINQRKK